MSGNRPSRRAGRAPRTDSAVASRGAGRSGGIRRKRATSGPQPDVSAQCHSAGHGKSSLAGFALVELLVVIAIMALLLAIFIPVAGAARERGQRAVCLSNLRQLTMAWLAYADQHDAKLVRGTATAVATDGTRRLEGWAGRAFWFPESRSALIADPHKGALWPYLRDIDIYRCPRGRPGHMLTYATVAAANGYSVEGTYLRSPNNIELTLFGKRVGRTVLKLTRLTDIVSPAAGRRAVFLDQGQTPGSDNFCVHYLYPKWDWGSPAPVRHADGVTLSMADGHAEYWKWRGRETVEMPRGLLPVRGVFAEVLADGDYEPQTEDGVYDLQRLQEATWGRLGYPVEDTG